MPRHREFDEYEVLTAAMNTFWSQGYEGTSIQDLENATGLTRTSIYNAYGNKRQLFQTIIEHYQDNVLAHLVALLDSGSTIQESVKKLLIGSIDLHFRQDTPGGCLILLSVLERDQHDEETTEMLEGILNQLQKTLQSKMTAALKRGELKKNADPRTLSNSVITTMAGLLVLGKAGFKKAALKRSADATVSMLG